MGRKNLPRDAFAHINPPKLPPPAEVWQMRERGEPVIMIAQRYGVRPRTVYQSLAKYRLKNGLAPLPVLTFRRFLESRPDAVDDFLRVFGYEPEEVAEECERVARDVLGKLRLDNGFET